MSEIIGPWICDQCDEVIEKPEDGYIIWKSEQGVGSHSFKIIHTGKCDDKDYTSSMPLTYYLGIDGLTRLLALLSIGPLKIDAGVISKNRIKDVNEYVDLIRRLQIPNYEQARRKFRNYLLQEDFHDSNETAPYTQNDLQHICENYNDDS